MLASLTSTDSESEIYADGNPPRFITVENRSKMLDVIQNITFNMIRCVISHVEQCGYEIGLIITFDEMR